MYAPAVKPFAVTAGCSTAGGETSRPMLGRNWREFVLIRGPQAAGMAAPVGSVIWPTTELEEVACVHAGVAPKHRIRPSTSKEAHTPMRSSRDVAFMTPPIVRTTSNQTPETRPQSTWPDGSEID